MTAGDPGPRGRFADVSAKARRAAAEALARTRARIAEALARRRVALGFACGAAVLVLARPTGRSIVAGIPAIAIGEGLRVWAAGHLNKSREITSSGPYRWFAHPLYVGSSTMAAGLAIACASVIVAAVIATYLAVTLTAAIRQEEAFLRRQFGDGYDRYRRGRNASRWTGRTKCFSLSQAIANGEHRTVAGVLVGLLLLVWKATYNGSFWRAAGP